MVIAAVPVMAGVVKAFAAVSAKVITPKVIAAGIGAVGAIGGQIVAKQAAVQTARYALGAAIAPWVGGVLLAGTVLYGGYKIIQCLNDKKDNIEFEAVKDGIKIKACNRPITTNEFEQAIKNSEFIDSLRKILREEFIKNKTDSTTAYNDVLSEIRKDSSYQNIPDSDKVRLARKLTQGLL